VLPSAAMQRLDPRSTLVVVVDVQERLAGAMPEADMTALLRATTILGKGAALLGGRIAVTEQYPKGLGHTLEGIRASVDGAPVFEKLAFSAVGCEPFKAFLSEVAPRAVVVVGMEAHVCVFQTVRDLARLGVVVHVPIDGVASRRDDHKRTGLALCEKAGAILTTAETIAFDWLERAGSDAFRELSKLIR
jgi:hypothetical protein